MKRVSSRKKELANRVVKQALRSLGQSCYQMKVRDAAALVVERLNLPAQNRFDKIEVADLITTLRAGDPKAFKRVAAASPKKPKPERRAWVTELVFDSAPANAPSENEISAFYESREWKRLSYQTKIARGRICECCGARPPEAVIHTDHIKPIRRYWGLRLDPSNTQILCLPCNHAKGSWDETDFRKPLASEAA